MRVRSIVLATLALALVSVNAHGEKWLTKRGADPDDRVLGHVANNNPDDFITCSKQHVTISTIHGAILKTANISCPGSATLDSVPDEEQERRDAEEKQRRRENDLRIIQRLTTSDDSGEDPQP